MSHSVTPSWWTPSTSAQLTELAISGETFLGCAGKLLAVQGGSYRQPGSDISACFRPIVASQKDKLSLQECLEVGREARVSQPTVYHRNHLL